MATVLDRPDATAEAPASPDAAPLLRRPRKTEGLVGWLTTIDHKRIGILYGVS